VVQSNSSAKRRKAKPKKPNKPYKEFPLFAREWAVGEEDQSPVVLLRTNPAGALDRYLAERDDLYAGRKPRPMKSDGLPIRELLNAFLNWIGGRLSFQGFAFSSCAASRNSVASSPSRDRLDASVDCARFRRWQSLFPRPIIRRNAELNSAAIHGFCETSHEIGIDQFLRRPPDSRDSWFIYHGKPGE
jgi:hypothetical protein